MTFNGFFLLIGVVFCIEGVRGAASSFGFGDFISSSTRPAVVAEHSPHQITGFQLDKTKAHDFLERTIGIHHEERQSPVGDLSRKRERPHGEIDIEWGGYGQQGSSCQVWCRDPTNGRKFYCCEPTNPHLSDGKGGYCEWDKDKDFPPNPPLLMNYNNWTPILPVLSDGKRMVRIPSGSKVVIACPGTIIEETKTNVEEGRCIGGFLYVKNENYLMTELGCESRFKETVRREKERCGDGGRGELSSIGYEVTGHPFYKLIDVCFHVPRETTLYTKHTLRGKSVSASDPKPLSRPNFKADGFFKVSPDNCYKIKSQEELMDKLGVNSIIINNRTNFFAKGHLAPDADFPSEMEASATYYYINAAPQWQIFNNGNWKNMEKAVRDLASRRGTDFQVWTGAWGTLKLDTTGSPHSIYLGLYEGQEVLPVPEVMWKVAYEPSKERGVAFIVVNHPDGTSFPSNLCTDICGLINWIHFNLKNPHKGAIYCCSVEDLRQAIPNAPSWSHHVGLLTD